MVKTGNYNFLEDLRGVWQHRELLYFLTQRELEVRYKQAFFGIAWAIITPLSQAVIFALIFGVFLKVSSGPTPYLLLVFSGLSFWNFFSQSITMATFALTGNYNLVTKSVFPKEILVISTVLARVPDLLFSFVVLLAMMFYYHQGLSLAALWVIPTFIIEVILTLGLGLFFAATNVFYRDVTALAPLLLMLWMYLTPIVYPLSSVPVHFRLLLSLNPMTGIISAIRSGLLMRQSPDLLLLAFSLVLTAAIFIVSYLQFKKSEKGFADII